MDWTLFDIGQRPALSLKQVAEYKYLGTLTCGTMWRTSLLKRQSRTLVNIKDSPVHSIRGDNLAFLGANRQLKVVTVSFHNTKEA